MHSFAHNYFKLRHAFLKSFYTGFIIIILFSIYFFSTSHGHMFRCDGYKYKMKAMTMVYNIQLILQTISINTSISIQFVLESKKPDTLPIWTHVPILFCSPQFSKVIDLKIIISLFMLIIHKTRIRFIRFKTCIQITLKNIERSSFIFCQFNERIILKWVNAIYNNPYLF